MMGKTLHYRMHHGEIRALVERIEVELDLERIAADAAPVAIVVRELFGKFGIHLAIEDAALYPKMLAHHDPEVRLAAQSFQNEMGGLKDAFDAYRRRWRGPTAIACEPDAFLAETTAVLAALRRRITREDEELYELYEGAM